MMGAETVAWAIHDANIDGVIYDPDSDGGTIFVNRVPAMPDVCVCVTEFGGQYLRWAGEGVSEFQIRVRGPEDDPHTASTLAHQIAAALRTAGYGPPSVWADDTDGEATIVYATPGVPASMGWDEQGRPEMVVRLTVRHAV